MRSVLQQLDSNESILLMYLSGELPEGDRTEVEQMLQRDAELREQLQRLRAAHQAIEQSLRRLDAHQPMARTEAAGMRQVNRLIHQWQIDQLAKSSREDQPRRQLRFPYWSYPLTAAAAITLAFVTWWYNLPEPERLVGGPVREFAVAEPNHTSTYETVELSEADPVQFASLISFDESRALSELEIELQQLEYLRELMQ